MEDDQTLNSNYRLVSLKPAKSEQITENSVGVPFIIKHWADYTTHHISLRHGRSLETIPTGKVLWADEYGNPMGAKSIKGPPFYTPRLQYDSNYPFEIRTKGLKDSLAVDSIDEVSDYMRRNGFPTERVIANHRLEEVIVRGKLVSVEEWKKSQLKKYSKKGGPKIKNRDGVPLPFDQIQAYLQDNEYFVQERDYQVGERIADISELSMANDGGVLKYRDGRIVLPTGDIFENIAALRVQLAKYETFLTTQAILGDNPDFIEKQQRILNDNWKPLLEFIEKNPEYNGWVEPGTTLKKGLGGVFRWINAINQPDTRRAIKTDIIFPPGEFKPFDIEKPQDIERYLTDYLPTVMGAYLGEFHSRLKLGHGFPNFHNWSLAGTLIDLDSVHGEAVGDEPITQDDVQNDLVFSVTAIKNLFVIPEDALSHWRNRGSQERRLYEGYICQLFGKEKVVSMFRDAEVKFLTTYFQHCSQENLDLLIAGLGLVEPPLRSVIQASFSANGGYSTESIENITQRVLEKLTAEALLRDLAS